MGIAKVTLNGVAQIDLTGVTVVAEKLHSGYSAVGADGEPVAGSYTPTPAGYQVSIDNLTEDSVNYPATITGLVNQGYYNGTVLFTVACAKACAVFYTTDNGATYTRLYAIANVGTNTYLFSVNISQAMTVIVAMKGDVNSDGLLDVQDVAMSNAFVGGQITLTDLQQQIIDVDASGTVDTTDTNMISAAQRNITPLDWDTVSS